MKFSLKLGFAEFQNVCWGELLHAEMIDYLDA